MDDCGCNVVEAKRRWWPRCRIDIAGLIVVCLMMAERTAAVGLDPDWSRLFAGEILVKALRNEHGVQGVRAMFTVTAPLGEIWAALVDYDNFPRMFPGIKELKVLEQDHKGAKLWFRTPVALMNYRYVLQRRYVEPGRRLTWTRVSGSFKSIDGSWSIRDTSRPGVYLMVYESYVRLRTPLPAKLVLKGAKRRVQRMSERLRTWIEAGGRES